MESECEEVNPRKDLPAKILRKVKQNLRVESKWREMNGALGDVGTYIPIALALTLARDLNLGTTLLFTGAYNLLNGAVHGLPMPVQPMKIIASVALSDPSFHLPEIMAAGISTSAVLFLLGATRLIDLLYRLVPLSVTRGVQLSQGLSFAFTALKYIQTNQERGGVARPWLGLEGLLLPVACAFFIILVNGAGEDKEERDLDNNREDKGKMIILRRVRRALFSAPSALLVFLLGGALAVTMRAPSKVGDKGFVLGPSKFGIVRISRESWKQGFIKGAVPQIPLTILNSVIAVVKLSSDLFPEREELSARSVAMSVGLMNLVGCWFGAMPCCLGAGGLAGQYKFGGRSGGCLAFLGGAHVVIGLVLGSSIVGVLVRFPVGVLGVLLLFAGIELGMAAKDMKSKEDMFVMLICTTVSLVGSGASFGFLCGMVAHLLLKLRYFEKENWDPRLLWLQRHNS